ncbi:MAG: class I SAM-dependent methyltransferase [Verrucomicrobiae bacterium]|nr:class I SAM-dependent methyltransferase [Verrucomicrobiae bacterium]
MSEYDYSIYYSRFHDDTEAHAGQMAAWLKELIRPHVPADRSVSIVDVGCGYGFALRALRDLGFNKLIGLEVSPEQAERSRKAGFEVAVTEDTIEWLKRYPGEFSFVLLLDVLEHVPVPVQIEFLRAIHGALAPGGKVLLTVPNANAILSARWRYNDFTHHSSFTEHSLYFVLKNAGFESVWMDSSKGVGRFPRRLWRRSAWASARKWLVRWCWHQIFKVEIPWEKLDDISFELNLKGVATKGQGPE